MGSRWTHLGRGRGGGRFGRRTNTTLRDFPVIIEGVSLRTCLPIYLTVAILHKTRIFKAAPLNTIRIPTNGFAIRR